MYFWCNIHWQSVISFHGSMLVRLGTNNRVATGHGGALIVHSSGMDCVLPMLLFVVTVGTRCFKNNTKVVLVNKLRAKKSELRLMLFPLTMLLALSLVKRSYHIGLGGN